MVAEAGEDAGDVHTWATQIPGRFSHVHACSGAIRGDQRMRRSRARMAGGETKTEWAEATGVASSMWAVCGLLERVWTR